MAKCDQGYRCDVCGEDVVDITDSGLYLRYVIGWSDPETLHVAPERHLRCDPTLSQFIVDPDFTPVEVAGGFDKRRMDREFVSAREQLVTRGFQRLRELHGAGDGVSVLDYPLPEVVELLRRKADSP
ncbi:MAG: hypothetical protein QGG36_29960 [Pirellulaceae bacterium]|jgi:hypothetical protein|nr:hypothetical protein [Pirellulaceae bacterium]MDP7020061.1 hypothetical protein [Pirellulaceae bacterium]